jgi:hypothetical protein
MTGNKKEIRGRADKGRKKAGLAGNREYSKIIDLSK